MDRDFVIKDQVKQFSYNLRKYEHEYDGSISFKDDLESELYNFYEPLDKLIYLYEIHKIIRNRYDKHLEKCKHKDNPENCTINSFCIKAMFFVEQEIKELNPSFDYTFLRPNINSNLLKENLIQLKDFPDAAKLFQSALDKLNEDRNERNLLDDLRLTLEITLKKILSNNKSIENQTSKIGAYLKEKNASSEVRNMFRTLIDYYAKYQNNYIKHNDEVKRDEIDLIVNLTGAFINYLINK